MKTVEHVVFGTGPIGRATMTALRKRGLTVRMINRSGHARVPDDVEVVAGDARDAEFSRAVTEGARVVYQTLNPAYYEWATEFPLLQAGVLAAAEAHGLLYVHMDNVYSYGPPHGHPLTEETSEHPTARKGRVRLEMAQRLWDAHRAGRVRVTSGRASDYYGPGGGASSPIGDMVLTAVTRGKTVSLLGDPDKLHSYTFIPDIGEGLATLGTDERAVGSAWHLPNDPQTQSSRQMVETLIGLAGTRAKVGTIPLLAVRALGLFNKTVREVVEMSYEFEQDFVVDSSRIGQLSVTATPIDEALEITLGAFQARS